MTAIFEGRKYNRAIRFHKLAYEAFMRVAWEGFYPWLDSCYPNETNEIKTSLEAIGDFVEDINKANHDDILQQLPFQHLCDRFTEYLGHLRNTNGPLSSFWISYIDMVELMLHMIRSSREGDWILHLSSVWQMLPWCFAYDAVKYSRYMSVYYGDMMSLPQEHPDVFEFMKFGGFSVQMGSSNPFGRIPVDQTVEETVNRDTETAGGTKGFSLRPGAVQRYYMMAEFRSLFLGNLREIVGYAK